jgi:prepilin peptidase CpaA
VPAALLGLAAHAVAGGTPGVAAAMFGTVVGMALFFPFFALGGLGGGDVKLMAALGAWTGAATIVWTAIYGAIAGGILALVVAAAHGYVQTAVANVGRLLGTWWLVGVRPVPEFTLAHGRGPRLPYAVPIVIGLVAAIWRQ